MHCFVIARPSNWFRFIKAHSYWCWTNDFENIQCYNADSIHLREKTLENKNFVCQQKGNVLGLFRMSQRFVFARKWWARGDWKRPLWRSQEDRYRHNNCFFPNAPLSVSDTRFVRNSRQTKKESLRTESSNSGARSLATDTEGVVK